MRPALIRPAAPSDATVLAELGRRTFVETFVEGFKVGYPDEDLQPFLEQAYSAESFARKIADPDLAVWIAQDASGPLAYATAGPNTLPHPDAQAADGELQRLYVAQEAQGLGLGRRLLETALEWLQARHPGPLWIGVWSGNDKAQRLYARYGFEKAGEYEFPVGRVRDREFILRRG